MNGKTEQFELLEPPSPEALLPATGLWPWIAGAALLVLLTTTVVVLWRMKRGTTANPAARRNAARKDAHKALDGLAPADTRDAATGCSLILRGYLSDACDDPALFETHEEFLTRESADPSLPRLPLTDTARLAAEEGFNRLAGLKYAARIEDGDPAAVVADTRELLETLHQGFAT